MARTSYRRGKHPIDSLVLREKWWWQPGKVCRRVGVRGAGGRGVRWCRRARGVRSGEWWTGLWTTRPGDSVARRDLGEVVHRLWSSPWPWAGRPVECSQSVTLDGPSLCHWSGGAWSCRFEPVVSAWQRASVRSAHVAVRQVSTARSALSTGRRVIMHRLTQDTACWGGHALPPLGVVFRLARDRCPPANYIGVLYRRPLRRAACTPLSPSTSRARK